MVVPRTARRADGTSTPGGAPPRTVRVSDAEWTAWRKAAAVQGLTISDLIRHATNAWVDER